MKWFAVGGSGMVLCLGGVIVCMQTFIHVTTTSNASEPQRDGIVTTQATRDTLRRLTSEDVTAILSEDQNTCVYSVDGHVVLIILNLQESPTQATHKDEAVFYSPQFGFMNASACTRNQEGEVKEETLGLFVAGMLPFKPQTTHFDILKRILGKPTDDEGSGTTIWVWKTQGGGKLKHFPSMSSTFIPEAILPEGGVNKAAFMDNCVMYTDAKGVTHSLHTLAQPTK